MNILRLPRFLHRLRNGIVRYWTVPCGCEISARRMASAEPTAAPAKLVKAKSR